MTPIRYPDESEVQAVLWKAIGEIRDATADGVSQEQITAIKEKALAEVEALRLLQARYLELLPVRFWLEGNGIPYEVKLDGDGFAFGFMTDHYAARYRAYMASLISLPEVP